MNIAAILKEKQERRAGIKSEIDALTAKVESRTWNESEDGKKLDDLTKEASAIDGEIRALTVRLQEEAAAATRRTVEVNPGKEGAPAIVTSTGDKRSKAASEFRLVKALNELSSPGGQLTGLEAEMAQEARQEARESGIRLSGNLNIPSWLVRAGSTMEQRDMTTTTTEGGYTVQTDIGRLIPLLDPRPVVRRMGATFLTGLSGNIDFPRNDAGASAAWETEQGAANATSPTVDRVQMAPNRLAAYTDVSRQVMIQSTIDMENFVRNRLNQAVSNALDTAALSGNGGNITGLISESGVNTVTFAASPTWAKLVQMETEVAADDADFGTLAYLFHPRIAGILKTNERTSTNGIYLMNGPNNGTAQVNGYNTMISSLVPTAAGSYYGFFGNWAKMLIGQWGGLDILVDPYTQATTGTVRIVTNSYWDVAVEHGQAFTVAISMHAS